MSFPSKSGSHPIKDEVGYRLSLYLYLDKQTSQMLFPFPKCTTKPEKSSLDSGRSRQLASKTRMSFYTIGLFSPALDLQSDPAKVKTWNTACKACTTPSYAQRSNPRFTKEKGKQVPTTKIKPTWYNHLLLETAAPHLLDQWPKNNFIKHLQSIRDVLEHERL